MPEYQNLAARALSGAAEYWDTPETIPFLCSLFSELLVKSAELVFDTSSPKAPAQQSCSSKKLFQAKSHLNSCFRKWKGAGKPSDRSHPSRHAYTSARSNFQRLRRHEESLANVRNNNILIHSAHHDRSKIYSRLKRLRGESSGHTTSLLKTPVGTYHGDDVLEGFAADAEFLGRSNSTLPVYDQQFYRLCKLDNFYIFEFQEDAQLDIPPMDLSELEYILKKKMKLGKSCDIHKLTVEHIRNCGTQAKLCVLGLINRILKDIYYLTCPQIKAGLGTAVYKGKNKPIIMSNSYRRITVTPIIGAIIDYYVDPVAESIFRQVQSADQLGFASVLSYFMAAVYEVNVRDRL